MLDTVFYFLLNMSLASCFVIAALLLVRLIRPLPRRIVYPLWALAFFRLVTPFTLPTGWSLFNFTGGLVKRLITVEMAVQSGTPAPTTTPLPVQAPGQGQGSLWAMNMIGAAEQYAPIEYKTESLRQVFQTASMTWAVVAAAALAAAFILYALTRKELAQAVRIKEGLYRSDLLLSPMLAGLFRQRIIIPASLDPDSAEGRMVLAHEHVHKRRLDNLWRLLAICIACAHWFNPLAWVMLKSFFADMEQSCDEAVIKKYNAEERKAYAGALLRFAEGKRASVSAAFGHSGVKLRIVNVLNYKRLTLAGVAASSAFLLIVALVLITNPQG